MSQSTLKHPGLLIFILVNVENKYKITEQNYPE